MARLVAALAAILLGAGASPAAELVPLPQQPAGVPYPTAEWPVAEPGLTVDESLLSGAIEAAFRDNPDRGLPDTRAFLVVHRGRVVAERYAEGYGPESRFESWSMAKSVTQCLVGILVGQGRLDLDAPAPVPAWQEAGDPRGALTLRNLLQMNTGLDNADGMEGSADSVISRLLFGPGAYDVANFSASFPLVHEPGTHWAYSTATSMLLADIVGRTVGNSRADTLDFMERELFTPLGLRRAVPEFDTKGTFLGGGFFFASAHDWARLGFLYLRDGVWEGRRVLPEGWVDFSRTPAPAENNGVFGAHLWLNRDPADDQFTILGGGSSSVFAFSGAFGQFVYIVPTHDLVVVRLGQMLGSSWDDLKNPIEQVISAFPPREDLP